MKLKDALQKKKFVVTSEVQSPIDQEPEELVESLKDKADGEMFDDGLDTFRLNVVLNQVKSSEDIHLGSAVKSVIRKYLGFYAEYTGYIRSDDTVLASLNEGIPFVRKYPTSRTVREIENTVENLCTDGRVSEVVI